MVMAILVALSQGFWWLRVRDVVGRGCGGVRFIARCAQFRWKSNGEGVRWRLPVTTEMLSGIAGAIKKGNERGKGLVMLRMILANS